MKVTLSGWCFPGSDYERIGRGRSNCFCGRQVSTSPQGIEGQRPTHAGVDALGTSGWRESVRGACHSFLESSRSGHHDREEDGVGSKKEEKSEKASRWDASFITGKEGSFPR